MNCSIDKLIKFQIKKQQKYKKTRIYLCEKLLFMRQYLISVQRDIKIQYLEHDVLFLYRNTKFKKMKKIVNRMRDYNKRVADKLILKINKHLLFLAEIEVSVVIYCKLKNQKCLKALSRLNNKKNK